ncbi:hypothetical protein CCACVL1_16947 [Corchorus capsularis]|uniref:Uncharacterized protein n=1 Tax=Corchorus capsularis TaxID=210143 RepID=A0A1R3HUT8_COCAP|nr:hypothetical protein CCACVL1_16947 [Corchorus capsularis]
MAVSSKQKMSSVKASASSYYRKTVRSYVSGYDF